MKLVDYQHPDKERWIEAASTLRELADRFEKGEITEAVIVYNDRERTCLGSWGFYDDRWRMLGALEYAKSGLL